MRDLRLLIPAAAAWTTAWLAVAGPDAGLDPRMVAGVVWIAGVAVLGLLLALGRPAHRGIVLLVGPLLLVALGASGLVATTAAAVIGQRDASPLASAADAHRTAQVVVEVVAAPRAMPAPAWGEASDHPTQRIDARLVAVDGTAVGPVRVTTSAQLPAAQAPLGSRLAFEARVSRLPDADPSGFRLRAIDEVVAMTPPPWLSWAGDLRRGFAEAAQGLDGDGAALVPGLAIGDTSAVGESLDFAMKASSLSHLTAVSGANCAVVTAAAFGLAALCRVRRAGRVAAAVIALLGFVVLVTPQPSVIRAGVMALVVLVALAAGRPGGGVTALAVAVIALLAFDPWLARDYGFALSAAATAGLLLLTAPVSALLSRIMPAPIAVVLAVPLSAQLACQPILVLLDPAIALYGVPANLLAAPAAPVGTVVGLLGCLVLPALPSVGMAFLQVAWLPASWIALVAHGAAGLPAARLPWLPDAPGALLLAACTGLALWLAGRPPRNSRIRASALAVLVACTAVPLGASVGGPLAGAATRPSDWDVAACDIGQGDAVLVRSAGATALIDTGPEAVALERCLALLGIERVDLLVLTHWDADHAGGAAAVAGRVDTVIHGPLDGQRSDRVLEPLGRAGADLVEVVAGQGGELGDARWRVVWPKPRAVPGNDASVVVEVDAPRFRGVFLGDLGEDAQGRLLRSVDLGRVDLVKVAHHGSADQSEALYRELGATVGVIGVGSDNGYGHPTDRLLDILAATSTAAVRTDQSGTALLTAGGDGSFELWSERNEPVAGASPETSPAASRAWTSKLGVGGGP